MIGNVVSFPATSKTLARPVEPEWTERIGFTPFIVIGIDKVADEETYIVWQQVLDELDCTVCPSQDVAAALLSHVFNLVFYSSALDNIGEGIFVPEVAAYHLRQVLKRLQPFAEILKASGFRHVDDVIDHRKHAEAMVRYEEESRLQDAEFHARLAEMEAAAARQWDASA